MIEKDNWKLINVSLWENGADSLYIKSRSGAYWPFSGIVVLRSDSGDATIEVHDGSDEDIGNYWTAEVSMPDDPTRWFWHCNAIDPDADSKNEEAAYAFYARYGIDLGEWAESAHDQLSEVARAENK